MWIKELNDGNKFVGPLMVCVMNKGVTDKGLNYASLILQDKSGSISAKKWDLSSEEEAILKVGSIIRIDAVVNLYKGSKQLKINSVCEVYDKESINLQDFQKISPIPQEELIARLNKHLDSIKNKDVSLITKTIINKIYDKYISYPAAVSVHHEFACGILHHSVAMADLACDVCERYPDLDKDLLISGALLHDGGKTIEYENPMTPALTLEGKLVGHISLMFHIYKQTIDELNLESEKSILIEHMILSHHGKMEWGSPVVPMTKEAFVLHWIDYMDSRLMIMDKVLGNLQEGEFSSRIWTLDDTCLYKPSK